MSQGEKHQGLLTVDSTVIVAFMVQGRPMAVNCLVTSEAPLYLFTKDPRIPSLDYPQTVVLVWNHAEGVTKGEGQAIAFHPWKTGHVLEVKRAMVAPSDRRVYPRFPIETSVSLRSVSDVRESTVFALSQGITKDISLGGAWVDVQPTLELGSIVEFCVTIEGSPIHALAVVAHENPNRGGNGLEFIDFFGDSHDRLRNALKKAA